MATALETLTAVVFINDPLYAWPNDPTATRYTVPSGKYAKVYIQQLKNQYNNGSISNVEVGEVTWPGPTGDGFYQYYASDADLTFSASHITMGRGPIILQEGQTIEYIIGAVTSLSFTAVVLEFNSP